MPDDPFFKREAEKYKTPVASREFILDYLKKRATPVKFEQLTKQFSVCGNDTQTEALRRRLRAMERDGQVIYTRNQRYALPDKLAMRTGTVIGHADGFGFLHPDDNQGDYYISPREMQKVAHGDVILAQIVGQDYKKRQDLRVVRILKPRSTELIGRYFVDHQVGVVIPDDKRLRWEVIIPDGQQAGARHGQVVVVDVQQRPNARQSAIGAIKQVLGELMDPGMEIQIALRSYDIPHIWPAAVQAQIAHFDTEVPEQATLGRVDLRKLPLVTIDGDDARDFDDAVFCEAKPSGGWRLWVAIADVAHYVQPGTPLDQEAANRGNSVYFPGEVIPMLPEVLSNGLCSLNPHVDRLCMVCEMTISAAGNLSGYQFYEAVINSHARLTYDQVTDLLDGNVHPKLHEKKLLPHLKTLEQMYEAQHQARQKRGVIEFETEETQFIFNAQRKIEQILPKSRHKAHKIIEECMIAANVAASRWVIRRKASTLFRVHDTPALEKINALRQFLSEVGLNLEGADAPQPRHFANLMLQVKQRADASLMQTMILRSMRQAVYQPDNLGHFGLALKSYAHFTSPIRRYPDLVLHRTLKALIHDHQKASQVGGYFYTNDTLTPLAEQCSMTERRADEATREVVDWLKCEFMQDHVGGEFAGVISTVTNFGFFVRLDALHIDGLVHVSQLKNDYYLFDAQHQQLIGEHTRQRYRVGDKAKIRVLAVRLDDKKIDFGLLEQRQQISKLKKKKSSPVANKTPKITSKEKNARSKSKSKKVVHAKSEQKLTTKARARHKKK